MKTRPGDQPLPRPNPDAPDMQTLVIADVEQRRAVGIERYGQGLKPHDGRDNLRDLYEELLDAAIYCRKQIYERGAGVDLIAHLRRQQAFSERTFGPGPRTEGLLAHIRSELDEIARNPSDVSEWIDVVLLALDGAWRHGHTPEAIAQALTTKQATNEARTWPDWRRAPAGQPLEHVRNEPVVDQGGQS